MKGCRMKVHGISETVGISTERVYNILHKKLHMKKLCARLLTKKTHAKGYFNAVSDV